MSVAVIKAGVVSKLLQSQFATGEEVSKSDTSPVTVADFAVQGIVLHFLHSAFPNDRFIAEESSTALRKDAELTESVLTAVNSVMPVPDHLTDEDLFRTIDLGGHSGGDGARTWILDPVDGTKGFMRGEQYCIALGLLDKGRAEMGILGCPNLPLSLTKDLSPIGSVFHAIRGRGAYMQQALVGAERTRLTQSSAVPMGDAYFMESVETAHSSHDVSAKIAEKLRIYNPPVRIDSQAKYGVLARSECHIFLRFPRGGYRENVWDILPGAVVIEEAGGCVTDGQGNDLDFSLGRKMDNQDGIVASCGISHADLIHTVQSVLHS